jgi:UDP-GlcNAc:undecaprenyl-phosphate/decaprenyl-phosphate GlcNAc-1-phosphate transferase
MGGFITFLIALGITTLLTPPLMRLAAPLRFLDSPNARKVHSHAVPRIGGVAMVLGSILAIAMGVELQREVGAFLIGIAVLSLFGVWDDRLELNYKTKLLGQLLASAIIVGYGGVVVERVPFLDQGLPYFVAAPLTLLVLLATINAINLSDGLDGLAGGVALLSLGTIAVIAQLAGAWDILTVSLAVIGSILAFLRFNTHPAVVFMGDTGSQFLGLSIGVLSIELTQEGAPALSSVVPFMLLGLPFVDTLMVMIERLHQRRSPFSADKSHIHHKLLRLGFDHYEAVLVVYLAQAAFVLMGFLLRYQWDALILAAYVAFNISVVAAFRWAAVSGWRVRSPTRKHTRQPASAVSRFLNERKLGNWALFYLVAAIMGYLYFAVLYPPEIALDVAVLALTLALVELGFSVLRGNRPFHTLERIGLYVASVLAVYLMHSTPNLDLLRGKLDEIFFMLLALAVVAVIRYSSKRHGFKLTPLDFLVLLLVLVLPGTFGFFLQQAAQWQLALAKLIVFLYAVELILTNLSFGWRWIRMGLAFGLLIAAFRGALL